MRRERLPRMSTIRTREEDTMKNVCWALFGFSILLTLATLALSTSGTTVISGSTSVLPPSAAWLR